MINGMIKLLGEPVDGIPSVDGLTTSWTVEGGPYKAIITEWTFTVDDTKHYRYELKFNHVSILPILPLSPTRSTATIEEAIERVEDALRDYIAAKAIIERRFEPKVTPNTILEYRIRKGKPSGG